MLLPNEACAKPRNDALPLTLVAVVSCTLCSDLHMQEKLRSDEKEDFHAEAHPQGAGHLYTTDKFPMSVSWLNAQATMDHKVQAVMVIIISILVSGIWRKIKMVLQNNYVCCVFHHHLIIMLTASNN